MSRDDVYCVADVIDALDILSDTYGIVDFYEDIEGPSTIHDTFFAEKCEIYLDMYKNNWQFVKYAPTAEDATDLVIQTLRDLMSEYLADDIVTSVEYAANKADVNYNIDSREDRTALTFSIEKEGEEPIDVDIEFQLGKGEFNEIGSDTYEVKEITVQLKTKDDFRNFVINENSNILKDIEDYIGRLV